MTFELNSFGKSNAQAQYFRQTEKMSDTTGLKRGRKPTLTDSGRKRRRTEINAKNNKNRIYIGNQYDRWMEVKCALRLQSNAEVAKILLDK